MRSSVSLVFEVSGGAPPSPEGGFRACACPATPSSLTEERAVELAGLVVAGAVPGLADGDGGGRQGLVAGPEHLAGRVGGLRRLGSGRLGGGVGLAFALAGPLASWTWALRGRVLGRGPSSSRCPPPPTVTTVGAAACTGLALTLLALLRPIRTPTPIASSSVPTPATIVVPEDARGRARRRRRGARSGDGRLGGRRAAPAGSREPGLAPALSAGHAVALVTGHRRFRSSCTGRAATAESERPRRRAHRVRSGWGSVATAGS